MLSDQKIGFDAYCDGLRIATVAYLKAGPTIGHWSLSWHTLNRIALQYGTDGSARIAHGLTPENATTIFIQLSKLQDAVLLDGHRAKWNDIAIFPPATHFTFVSGHHLSWLAIAIPRHSQNGGTPPAEFMNSAHLFEKKSMMTLSPSAANNFIQAGLSIRTCVANLSEGREATSVTAAEDDFVTTLDRLLTQHVDATFLPSDYNEAAERIVFGALEYVRTHSSEPITVEDLTTATNVEYRTLLRAFHRYLNVGPKHYLKLRQLNLVRLALRHNTDRSRNVTNILSEYGVTEFGRFAIEYKRLFGEAPSETHGAKT